MLREQRGAASVYVLVMMIIVIVALSSLQSHLIASVAHQSNSHSHYEAELQAAAGQEEARALLIADPNYGFEPGYSPRWSYPSSSATNGYDVTISQPAAYQRRVVSRGWANGASYTVSHVYQFASPFPVITPGDGGGNGGCNQNGDANQDGNNQNCDQNGNSQNCNNGNGDANQNGDNQNCSQNTGSNGSGGGGGFALPAITKPDETKIRNAATTLITLDATNTCSGTFYIGGNHDPSCTLPDTANTADSSPFRFHAANNAIYIQAASGQSFQVIIDNLVYQGSGLIALGSAGLTVGFAESATIRRAAVGGVPVAGSSLSLVILPAAGASLPTRLTFEGVPYMLRVTGQPQQLTLTADRDVLNFASYQLPGMVAWSIVA